MRHDSHYVDQLGRPGGAPVGRLVPIEDIDPNPNQPRQTVGDLSELVASVREKGILEPILVRPSGSRFEIIAGERRYRAAIEVGSRGDAVRGARGLRRRDDGDRAHREPPAQGPEPVRGGRRPASLAEAYEYTHEKMAQKLGKSRTSVTEVLSLTNMPAPVRELCRLADISSKSLLLQIVRQSTPEKMVELIERLQADGVTTRKEARAALKPVKAGRGRPKHFVFRYQPKEKSFNLALQFKRSDVPREDVVRALQSIIDELMSQPEGAS
jgi:ParB family chromosome partitioning protein